jgi:hypothetical protein
VPHTPALTHTLCKTKHVLAGPGVSRFNPCFDHQMPREAIILTHALTLLNHQLVRYACGMGASNQTCNNSYRIAFSSMGLCPVWAGQACSGRPLVFHVSGPVWVTAVLVAAARVTSIYLAFCRGTFPQPLWSQALGVATVRCGATPCWWGRMASRCHGVGWRSNSATLLLWVPSTPLLMPSLRVTRCTKWARTSSTGSRCGPFGSRTAPCMLTSRWRWSI